MKFEFFVVFFRHVGHLDYEYFYFRTLGSPCPILSLAPQLMEYIIGEKNRKYLKILRNHNAIVLVPVSHEMLLGDLADEWIHL
ncbi:hypothetical protein GCM10023310_13860 [Paenibacillus vulneris]